MASERPIRVMTLSVKPSAMMMMNELMTLMGRVRPVMTVERHELRKQKTMKIVSKPPRMSVICTSSTDSRMKLDSSRTT